MLSGKNLNRAKADMRRKNKTLLVRRTADILQNNEGASIVLVTIIAVIVVTSVIILSVNVNALMAAANKQYNQDQAYEAARSMGEALDDNINSQKFDLSDYADYSEHEGYIINDSYEDITVAVKIERRGMDTYAVIVTAIASGEEYVYTAIYYGTDKTYMRLS